MKFIDEAKIWVTAGNGGAGCVSFRREKYVPRGGPDGGSGGAGGDVILEADPGRNTLMDLKGKRHFRAGHGGSGRGKGMTGRCGRHEWIYVPVGTVVRDEQSGEVLADLVHGGDRFVVAQGGMGGRGNLSFATSTNRAPRYAQPGLPGQEREIVLELKLLADVGLVGRPNAGKSTLISRVSAARPKIADYPFTTLVPQLGVVSVSGHRSFVMADIPGLIEGAHEGAGMGTRFLKHIERTRIFLHLIDPTDPQHTDPWESFQKINQELSSFSTAFSERPQWVVLTKSELWSQGESKKRIEKPFRKSRYPLYVISAVTGSGLERLIEDLATFIFQDLNRIQI